MTYNVVLEKLERIRKNPQSLVHLAEALDRLQVSGIIDFLKAVFQPRLRQTMQEGVEQNALANAYAAGANEAIESLLFFKEMWFAKPEEPKTPRADFGSTIANKETGDLTQEEINAIKSGKRPDYNKHLKPVPKPPTS